MNLHVYMCSNGAFQVALVVKNPPTNAGDVRDMGSIPASGRCPGEENGSLLQYSCLENPMDRGASQAPWGCKESDTTVRFSLFVVDPFIPIFKADRQYVFHRP